MHQIDLSKPSAPADADPLRTAITSIAYTVLLVLVLIVPAVVIGIWRWAL